MSRIGSYQTVRCFLEGQEVPLQSAVITSQVGVPVSATVSLVPLREIKFVRPRTQLHLFMQDTKNFPDDNFYLVFEGEVLGRTMTKKQDGRGFSVVAIDYSSYWDETKAYVMNPNFVLGKVEDVITFQDAPIGQQVKELGGVALTTSATSTTRVVEIMLAHGNKDLAKGVFNVINTLNKANQFYQAAYERLNINTRIRLFSGGNLQAFLNDLKLDDFLANFTGSFGGIKSLRELLYSVLGLVFHDFVSIPFPAYVPAVVASPANNYPGTKTGQSAISQFMFVPDCYSLPAPACNVVFPNQQTGYSFSEDFRAYPTRYSFRASFPLMTGNNVSYPQYPTQFYPTCFSDYMYGKHTASATESASMIGPSTLLTDPTTGNTYAKIFYGQVQTSKKTVVGTSFGVALREADYLSNEESLKGIYLEMDTFMPSYTALVKGATPAARTAFIQAIGAYLFYKKRFSARQVTAELLFNPYLVPGFNALFLDDSEAGQSFIAKLQSVSHTLSNDGCATNVSLAYGRDFDELDELTGGSDEPPTPPWFDPNVFGSVSKSIYKQETTYLSQLGAIDADEVTARNNISNPTVFPALNQFFQYLLGCNSTTNYTAPPASSKKTPTNPVLVSTRGAVSYLLYQYNQVSQNPDARDEKVRELTSRPLVPILEAFKFIRAQPVGYNNNVNFTLPSEFASFEGQTTNVDLPGRFDGINPNSTSSNNKYADYGAIELRREVIEDYVDVLKTRVGFNG